jgi:sodium transport system permease protein
MMQNRALRQALVVLRKELIDSLRDRRAIASIVLSMALGPVLISFMMNRGIERQRGADEIRIPVVGAEYAPTLVAWLEQQDGVTISPGPPEAEEAVRTDAEDLVLVIPKDFAERFRESRPAPVELVTDGSRRSAQPTVARVRRMLQVYGAEIASLRLIARGVAPAVMTPLRVDDIEISTAQQRAAQVLSFIPMFIILAAFSGGMSIATDSTAGERERGSLEPLLVNPAPRGALVAGKWMAAATVAMVCSMVTMGLCLSMPRFISLAELGIRFTLGLEHVGGIAAAVLPLCLLSSAMQMCIATMARSFKEAQSYMGILIFATTIPGVVNALYPLGNAAWMYLVPVAGPFALLTRVIGNEPPGPWAFAAAAAVSLGGAFLLAQTTSRLFRSERIIFGR